VRFTHAFVLAVPPATVYGILADVAAAAALVPGLELTGHHEERFAGRWSVRLGAVLMQFQGAGRFVVRVPDRRLMIELSGRDPRLGGTLVATVLSTLRATPGGDTRVAITVEWALAGASFRLSARLLRATLRRVLRDYEDALRAGLAGDEPAPVGAPERRRFWRGWRPASYLMVFVSGAACAWLVQAVLG
jgi:carbon monoxide dehydrogenase subunit G